MVSVAMEFIHEGTGGAVTWPPGVGHPMPDPMQHFFTAAAGGGCGVHEGRLTAPALARCVEWLRAVESAVLGGAGRSEREAWRVLAPVTAILR